MTLVEKKCDPCEGKTSQLTDVQEDELLKEVPTWYIDRTAVHRLRKQFKFKSFMEGIDFVYHIALIAEKQQHHPNIDISFTKISIDVWTHAIGGLSENDFILAAKIDRAGKPELQKTLDWEI